MGDVLKFPDPPSFGCSPVGMLIVRLVFGAEAQVSGTLGDVILAKLWREGFKVVPLTDEDLNKGDQT